MINRYFVNASRMLSALLLGLALVLPGAGLRAQVVTWSPAFPTMDDSLTIFFHALEGDGGMANFNGTVYGHFGLVVAGPTSTAWTQVQGNWGTADPRVRMTSLGNKVYSISFVPRRYFNNRPASVVGYRIAMVFRSADGNTTGRNANGSDIFMPLYQPGQQALRIERPSDDMTFLVSGSTLPVNVVASNAGPLVLEANGVNIASANDSVLNYDFVGTSAGLVTLRAGISGVGGTNYLDSVQVLVLDNQPRQAAPAGWKLGPNYLSPTSVGLLVAAPRKKFAFVTGDFDNWTLNSAGQMHQTPDSSYFWIQLDNLTAGQEYAYQFLFDGSVKVADPLAEKILDPNNDRTIPISVYPNLKPYPNGKTTGIVSTFTPGATPYVWRHPRPTPPAKTKMFVYELLLRDFLGRAQDKTFQGLIDTIAYLHKLGVTTVELMPVSEFDGNNSWGYNPNFHGAVDKAYGPADKLKALVDTCHGLGMQVVLDVVYNHAWGLSPILQMYPAAANPYANAVARHPFNVGTDLNHESPFTREYVNRCNERWLRDYNIDGFRFDLSKGLTQTNSGNDVNAWGNYDASRIAILNSYRTFAQQVYPQVLLILEHFAATQEERELTTAGFFTWGNMTGAYRDAAKGISLSSSFAGSYYPNRGLTVPNAVIYMESHDEERIIYDVVNDGRSFGGYNTRDSITAYDRMKLAAVFFFAVPGPKMIWQFGELGYPYSINTCPNGTVNGCRVDPKPVRWSYVRNPYRQSIYKVYQSMMKLVKDEPVFSTLPTNQVVNGAVRRISFSHPDGNVLVVGNFSLAAQTTTSGLAAGRWYEFFTADSLTSGGPTDQITLAPGEYRIYSQKRFFNPGPGVVLGLEDEVMPGAFVAYPNPTTGKITVASRGEVRLEDMQGRLLQMAKPHDGQAHLDLSACRPGLYLVRTQGRVQRVVKQ